MNTVTFETAMRLKNAGFPQPRENAGQFWWGKKSAGDSEPGSLCVLIGTDAGALNFKPVDGIENANNRFFIFAPTATDILRDLPEHSLEFWQPESTFFVENEPTGEQWVNDNPDEAAASAWLSIRVPRSPGFLLQQS